MTNKISKIALTMIDDHVLTGVQSKGDAEKLATWIFKKFSADMFFILPDMEHFFYKLRVTTTHGSNYAISLLCKTLIPNIYTLLQTR